MEKKNKQIKFWVMALILGLLVVISGVQAMELANLKEKINTDITGLSVVAKQPVTKAKSPDTLKSNLANLPNMVGGC